MYNIRLIFVTGGSLLFSHGCFYKNLFVCNEHLLDKGVQIV